LFRAALMMLAVIAALPPHLSHAQGAPLAIETQTYFAKAVKKPAPKPASKPAPKPRRSDWATTQANLECPPPARPACGR
jgi:hypothetical protein